MRGWATGSFHLWHGPRRSAVPSLTKQAQTCGLVFLAPSALALDCAWGKYCQRPCIYRGIEKRRLCQISSNARTYI